MVKGLGVKELRVVLIDGPGDAIQSFGYWRQGLDNPGVTHVPFSGQFFAACDAVGAKVWLVGQHARIERLVDGPFVIEHRGNQADGKSGAAYHLADMSQALRLIADIVRFRPDVVISTERPNPFLLHLLRPFGIKVVINLHCVLWCKYGTQSRLGRLITRLNASFFRHGCTAIACVSDDIKQQVRQLRGTAQPAVPFVDFLPWFRDATFTSIPAPDPEQRPTRVMFAGRVERNKGVFDLLAIAKRLRARGRHDIVFELCGTGSALDDLRAQATGSGLTETFVLRGHCSREQMSETFGRCHFVVVPTTTAFNEGFNMVIAEAVLAQRPVITSDVCPGMAYVRSAVLAVPPDDVDAYEAAILTLADDRAAYASLQRHCATAGQRFMSESTSYQSAMQHILGSLARGEPVAPREIAVTP